MIDARRIAALALAPLIMAGTLAVAAPAAQAAEFAPQGGKWAADGSPGPTYGIGMPMSKATGIAIGQYQRVLRVPITYKYDAATQAAVLRHQQSRNWIRDTGNIDFPTSRSLFAPFIEREARSAGMSPRALCGHLWVESRIDPGAVGPGGIDFGIAQIVPRYRPGNSGWDAIGSIRRMARDDAAAIKKYGAWGQVAWWKPAEARAAAAGRPSAKAAAYRNNIAKAPCGGFAV